MANKTIDQLTATTSASPLDDLLIMHDTSESETRRITLSNAIASVLGSGTIIGSDGILRVPATIYVGTGSGTNSVDAAVNVNRAVNDTGSGNAHCFSDSSRVSRAPSPGAIGYNSFDARMTFTGATSWNHYAGFQYAPTFESSGGVIDYMYGFYLADPVVSNSGTINHNYGIYLQTMDNGVDNISIRTGANRCEFNGDLYIGANVYIGQNSGATGRVLMVNSGSVRFPGSGYQLEFGGNKVGITGDNGGNTVSLFTGQANKLTVTASGDIQANIAGRGILLTNAAGTVTRRIRLSDTGSSLIIEAV